METNHIVKRRSFLKSASVLVSAAIVQGVPLGATALAAPAMSDAEKWTHAMAALGPRITCGQAHRKWITYLANAVSAMGLQVRRYPVPVRYWEATAWSLEVTDRAGRVTPIPVANYVPYAGETSAEGITGQLADLGLGAAENYANRDVTGKVVLVDKIFPGDRSVRDYIGPLIAAYPPDLDAGHLSLVGRPASGGGNNISALLATAKAQSASAAIVVLDLPPEAAARQFTPHQQREISFPSLSLDRIQGARLRRLMAEGPITTKVVLQATRDDGAMVDYVVAKLPGNGKYKGAVCLLTHTDGQNAIEENGGPALLAIAKHFSSVPVAQRDRDLYLIFSACHMKNGSENTDPEVFLKRLQPAIGNEIAMIFTIEHLGGKEWRVSADKATYAPTGERDMWILGMTDNPTLKSISLDELKKWNFKKLLVTLPPRNLYGEGTYTKNDYPSIAAFADGEHLLQLWNDDKSATDLIDFDFMNEQVAFFTTLTGRFLSAPGF
jgi:hypothetical protein